MIVFITSTYLDLKAERAAAQQALSQGEAQPWGMEFFNSSPEKPLSVCLKQVAACDAVVLVIGGRAGALAPEADGLTYTGAEIAEAITLGKPVFPFIGLRDGREPNDEPPGHLHDSLEQLRTDVKGMTPAFFTSCEDLKFKVLAAFLEWTERGRPGARKTFAAADEYFAPYSNAPRERRLFDFAQTMVNRHTQMNSLNAFLAAPNRGVAVLPGRGGIGKTKLLMEFAAQISGVSVMFLRRGAIWHRESDKEIPAGSLLLIADDVHRDADLPRLVQCVQDLRSTRRQVKLILSCRPRGLEAVDAVLAREFDPSEIERFAPLEKLSSAEVRQIVFEELGSHADPRLVEWLVSISADTPLVTVAGARLLKHGEIQHVGDLTSSEDFQRLVFDKFVDEIDVVGEPPPMRKLIEILAAIGPIWPRSDSLNADIADYLKCQEHEVVQSINLLEERGLLIHGEGGVRVAPDALADRVLERACLASGASTGYAEFALQRFGRHGNRQQILANLGEIDWRASRQTDGRVSILDGVWREIVEAFRGADALTRHEILTEIENAAVYKPVRALEICQIAIETDAPERANSWMGKNTDVLAKLPGILKAVAVHHGHIGVAVPHLLELHRRKVPGALRQAKELATIRPGRGESERISEVLSAIEGTILDPSLYGAEESILDLLDEVLEREIEWSRLDEMQVTFISQPLHYTEMKSLRNRCFPMLEQCLAANDPCIAMRALRSLFKILGHFMPRWGQREIPPGEGAWHDEERFVALEILRERVSHQDVGVPLKQQIFSGLRSHHRSWRSEAVNRRLDEILATAPTTQDYLSFDAFVTPSWNWAPPAHEDVSTREEQYCAWIKSSAASFLAAYTEPAIQISRLEDLAKLFEGACIKECAAGSLVSALALQSAIFAAAFVEYVSGSPHPLLGVEIRAVLALLRQSDGVSFQAIALHLANHPSPEVALGVSYSIRWEGDSGRCQEDFAVIRGLARHPSNYVRSRAIQLAGFAGRDAAFAGRAAAIIASTRLTGWEPGRELWMAIGPHGTPAQAFTEPQMRSVLENLVEGERIDSYQSHGAKFLEGIAEVFRELIVELFLLRLKRSASRHSGYSAWGGLNLLKYVAGLSQSPRFIEFLRNARDLGVDEGVSGYSARELFWCIGGADPRADQVLAEWLSELDPTRRGLAESWSQDRDYRHADMHEVTEVIHKEQ